MSNHIRAHEQKTCFTDCCFHGYHTVASAVGAARAFDFFIFDRLLIAFVSG